MLVQATQFDPFSARDYNRKFKEHIAKAQQEEAKAKAQEIQDASPTKRDVEIFPFPKKHKKPHKPQDTPRNPSESEPVWDEVENPQHDPDLIGYKRRKFAYVDELRAYFTDGSFGPIEEKMHAQDKEQYRRMHQAARVNAARGAWKRDVEVLPIDQLQKMPSKHRKPTKAKPEANSASSTPPVILTATEFTEWNKNLRAISPKKNGKGKCWRAFCHSEKRDVEHEDAVLDWAVLSPEEQAGLVEYLTQNPPVYLGAFLDDKYISRKEGSAIESREVSSANPKEKHGKEEEWDSVQERIEAYQFGTPIADLREAKSHHRNGEQWNENGRQQHKRDVDGELDALSEDSALNWLILLPYGSVLKNMPVMALANDSPEDVNKNTEQRMLQQEKGSNGTEYISSATTTLTGSTSSSTTSVDATIPTGIKLRLEQEGTKKHHHYPIRYLPGRLISLSESYNRLLTTFYEKVGYPNQLAKSSASRNASSPTSNSTNYDQYRQTSSLKAESNSTNFLRRSVGKPQEVKHINTLPSETFTNRQETEKRDRLLKVEGENDGDLTPAEKKLEKSVKTWL